MLYQNISDCHNHSNCSYDGKDSVSAMCRRGADLGLLYHTLTDHCECDEYIRETNDYISVVKKAYADMLDAQKKLGESFLLGIELGQPLQNIAAVEDALSGRNYDFVIGSLHCLPNMPDFYFWDQVRLPLYTALDHYFEELRQMVLWGKFDTLAHLTYPLRYIVGEHGIPVDFDRYTERIRELYGIMIEKGIALELNTSGLRQKIGETLPNLELMTLYRKLGGELVTIGSDAHCTADLGKGIQEGLALLAQAGFSYYTVYKNRKPMMIAIR
ncbi:MAG: histidinol-phosphatase HisJ family protein [Oscillospiraceae bacterium]